MNAVSPNWQRLAIFGVCGSAGVFLAGSAWQVVGVLAPVLGLFFGGWLLSCVLEPLVGQITLHTRASRSGAVVAAYLSVVSALGMVWIVAAPTLALQLTTSVTNLPSQVEAATQRILAAQVIVSTWLAQHGVPVQLDLVSTRSFETLARESAAPSPLTAVQELTSALGSAGMMLLLSVFFLVGGPQLADQVISSFGDRAAPDVKFVLTAIHDAFESFARAQLIQALLFAGAVWVCLAVAQVETAPLVGAIAGALLLVPVVGAALALVFPLVGLIARCAYWPNSFRLPTKRTHFGSQRSWPTSTASSVLTVA
jgi:predicted PurR-regulated permease PerM